ncbi:hypothetical protein [Leptospira licerasiae]|uniref:Uncharacterized protein n=1 Tax=Leptospira licerasiae str. MMD4847 TaxID=1049971 RepID=A0ABP2RCP7_9LEPT|nr:hypothetical protein [Leptospira licerasiae]EIE01473.1 hypothetical protein LEP1GSC185_3943 [Leptospira licerasiae serovar Varillal str. VAR 010]EJZ42289.1 hypothetical protein LEP1GSC178_0012 [Leptospira licerasiae str. MMD4847]
MEYHRIHFDLLTRDGVAVERLLEKFEKEYAVQEPQRLTKNITQTDNLVDIPIPLGIEFKYVIILATYKENDTAIAVKASDPAPVKVRLNGSSDEIELTEGFLAWTGSLNSLRVSTQYSTNKIRVEVYLG